MRGRRPVPAARRVLGACALRAGLRALLSPRAPRRTTDSGAKFKGMVADAGMSAGMGSLMRNLPFSL